MGANAQTTVPSFTVGQVLTADQQNQSARTGVPVFATSVERDAAFGGSGEKTLAEGQLAYLEDSDIVQYYDGAVWQSVSVTSGLAFITAAAFTAVTSVSLPNDTFTSTYDNYKVILVTTASSGNAAQSIRLRAAGSDDTAANYKTNGVGLDTVNVARNFVGDNLTSFVTGRTDGVNIAYSFNIDVLAPKLARMTVLSGWCTHEQAAVFGGATTGQNGFYITTATFDSLSLIVAGGATITGSYFVYGYRNS